MMPSHMHNQEYNRISALLGNFPGSRLMGLTNPQRLRTLILQIIDSKRRIEYLNIIINRSSSPSLCIPYSGCFNPLRGAIVHLRAGRIDDAYWLVYLATHFGKHKADRWNLTENFYGRLNQGNVWDWATASQNPQAVRQWVEENSLALKNTGRFGSHRRYESLQPIPNGTGRALQTYIEWICRNGSHQALLHSIHQLVGQNPTEVFNRLYRNLSNVRRLGRLGKFDLLCNLGNLSIAPVSPDRAYIKESTGPKVGARLLFGNGINSQRLEDACVALAMHLNVSPQVIEDALCNWQKSPERHEYFKG